jgi:hypothetical protein
MAEQKQHPSLLGQLISSVTGGSPAKSVSEMDLEEFRQTMEQIAREDADKMAIIRDSLGITQSLQTPEQVQQSIQSAKGGPDTTTMVDVTDTEMGQLSNPQPLFDMARQVREEDIQVSPLDQGQPSSRFDTKGQLPEEQAPRNADEGFSPIEKSIEQKTKNFYLNIGEQAESDHGSVPVATKDAREKDLPVDQRSKDIGFGHKIKASEEASGMIHGIQFKNEDGTYIELTEDQKVEILNKDMAAELSLARAGSGGKKGWDAKLKDLGITWDDLDYKYQNVLTSLAYNVGGGKAGTGWTAVLTAAKNQDPVAFAEELRRKDAGNNTAGMDNRVLKELFYAGIISGRDEVSSVLPLGDRRSGVPK